MNNFNLVIDKKNNSSTNFNSSNLKYSTYYSKNFFDKKEAILQQVNKSYKYDDSKNHSNNHYATNMNFHKNSNIRNKQVKNINSNNIEESEIFSVLKQNKYNERPISSKVQKRDFLKNSSDLLSPNEILNLERPISRKSNGIFLEKEEDDIPILNMFGGNPEEDDITNSYEENDANNNIINNNQNAFKKADNEYQVKSNNYRKFYETDYKEVIKIKSNNNNINSNRMSAKPKLPFETKLSPDFLNLFSK